MKKNSFFVNIIKSLGKPLNEKEFNTKNDKPIISEQIYSHDSKEPNKMEVQSRFVKRNRRKRIRYIVTFMVSVALFLACSVFFINLKNSHDLKVLTTETEQLFTNEKLDDVSATASSDTVSTLTDRLKTLPNSTKKRNLLDKCKRASDMVAYTENYRLLYKDGLLKKTVNAKTIQSKSNNLKATFDSNSYFYKKYYNKLISVKKLNVDSRKVHRVFVLSTDKGKSLPAEEVTLSLVKLMTPLKSKSELIRDDWESMSVLRKKKEIYSNADDTLDKNATPDTQSDGSKGSESTSFSSSFDSSTLEKTRAFDYSRYANKSSEVTSNSRNASNSQSYSSKVASPSTSSTKKVENNARSDETTRYQPKQSRKYNSDITDDES